MTVRELMEMLSQFSPDLEVRFADTYGREEGTLPGHDTMTCAVGEVHFDVAECCVVLETDW